MRAFFAGLCARRNRTHTRFVGDRLHRSSPDIRSTQQPSERSAGPRTLWLATPVRRGGRRGRGGVHAPRGGQHCWSAGLLISLPVRLACLIISTACLFATPVGQYASAHLGWWCYGELLRARTPPAHAHCLFGPPRPMPYTIASHRLAHTSTIPALHCFHFLGFIYFRRRGM